MNAKDIKTTEDVIAWLRYHVEWRDEHSADCMIQAAKVLRKEAPTTKRYSEEDVKELLEYARFRGARGAFEEVGHAIARIEARAHADGDKVRSDVANECLRAVAQIRERRSRSGR